MEGVLNWCQHNVNVGQQKRWVTLQLKCIDNDSTNITTFLAGLPSADLAMGTDTKNGTLLTSVHRIVGNMSFLINVGYPSNSGVYRDKRQHTAQDFLWREVARLSKCMAILTVQRTQEFDFETKLEIVDRPSCLNWKLNDHSLQILLRDGGHFGIRDDTVSTFLMLMSSCCGTFVCSDHTLPPKRQTSYLQG